ncbi:MAG: SLC13 family permease [Acidobacteriota bacterium]|nr:MAG: SLC13 family permease [Acidobacteriota bacterium]
MTFEIATVLALLLIAVVLFAAERFPVDLVALIVMALLLVSGLITPAEGISGFSNSATVTVAAMFILSAGLFKTGVVNYLGTIIGRLFKYNFLLALIGVMIAVGFFSAFINNTPVVAIFVPLLLGIAREIKASPSKMLMPVSFASMFGGVCTLIGSSTNILVSSIAEQHGQRPFSMFEFAPLGLVMFAAGTLYMLLIGRRLIPDRRSAEGLTQTFGMGEYLTEIILLPDAKSVGEPLGKSPLVQEVDIEIIEVHRKGRLLVLPPPETLLRAGDILRVRCDVEKIRKLQERLGIKLRADEQWPDQAEQADELILVEAVIAPNSALVGKSLKQLRFRDVFGSVALAIRHRGTLMRGHLENIRLSAGDALLLKVKRDHLDQLKQDLAFVIVSEVGLPEYRKRKMIPALLIILGVVAVAALDVAPILVSAIAGCVLLILTGCLDPEDVYRAIEWKVIFLLAGILPLGIAMEKTGAALFISKGLLSLVGAWGPIAVVSTLYLVTSLLTEAMSNNATAVLLAPIAISTAEALGVDSRPLLMAVTFAASASFMTPVGYQTNTLIYGPGQYRFSDFLRVGTPLNILFWVLATLLIPRFWPF